MKNHMNAVVIGGTDGVGKIIATGLAHAGCNVLITGRNAEKGAYVKTEIQKETGNQNIHFISTELSLIGNATHLTDMIAAQFTEIQYLVHSAGIILGKFVITPEGIETNFAVNYLSRFAISLRLLPLLKKSGRPGNPARILLISGALMNGKIHYEDINLTGNFSLIHFVSQQCRANDLFAIELADKLSVANCNTVTVNVYKLGVVKTNIRKTFPLWMKWLVTLVFDPLIGLTTRQAAEPAIKLLLDKEYQNVSGALFLKIRKFKRVIPSKKMLDKNDRIRLWDLSERMTESYYPKNT